VLRRGHVDRDITHNPRAQYKRPNTSKFVALSIQSGLEKGTRITKADGSQVRSNPAPTSHRTTEPYCVARAGAVLLYAILPPTNVITGLMSLI